MDYAPVEYPINNEELSNNLDDNISGNINDNIGSCNYGFCGFNNIINAPVTCIPTIYNDSLVIRENLLNIIQKKEEIIVIDNEQYKNKEIDEIVTKIESFVPEFKKLQDELDSIHKEYIRHTEKTKKDIQTIEKSVQFMKSIENKYNEDKSVKEIVDKLNKYSESILKNEILSEIREKYINKRKELNSFIYFLQKINKWNVCNMCPMCFSNKVDSYCNPCGHTGCKECFNRQTELTSNETFDVNNSKKCPFCRDYIIDIKPLYFL